MSTRVGRAVAAGTLVVAAVAFVSLGSAAPGRDSGSLPAIGIPAQPLVVERVLGTGEFVAVTGFAGGFVAASSEGEAFYSADGRVWTPAKTNPVFGDAAIADLTGVDGLVVAAGVDRIEGDESRASFWHGDGSTWHRADMPEEAPGAETDVHAVGRWGDTFVALGRRIEVDGSAGAAVWLSADGMSWQSADWSGRLGTRVLGTVSVGSQLVAFGMTTPMFGGRATAWTTVDAGRWAEASAPEDGYFSAVYAGLVDGGRLILAGSDSESTVGIWEMVGGRLQPTARLGQGSVRALARLDELLVAAGIARVDGRVRAALWTKPDGQNRWNRVAAREVVYGGSGRTTIVDAAARDGVLVAVGEGGIWRIRLALRQEAGP